MKKSLSFIMLFTLALLGCSISPQAVQTAIAETESVWTPTVAITPLPTSTLTPIPLPPTPTTTPIPLPPTSTPVIKTTYILEQGFCLVYIGKVNGNPKDVPGCLVEKRKQIQLAPNESVTVTLNSNITNEEIFCSLYSLDGTYIMSDLDVIGSLKATCMPK